MTTLTPAQTRALLEQLGHQPRKGLGQNFLVDGNIVRKSLELSQLSPQDTVVEVGPGLGTLTASMLAQGARVHAIELDKRLFTHLRDTLLSKYSKHLVLFEGDAVEHPTAGWTPDRPYKVVANLPYAISTPWLEKLLSSEALPSCMVLMLQKEAADRFQAPLNHKHYGAVSIFLQSAYKLAATHLVSKQCFYPVPQVDSALVCYQLLPQAFIFRALAKATIRTIFTQRRKQIQGIIKNWEAKPKGLTDWLEALPNSYNTPLQARPEAIPIAAWQALDRFITKA